ncbi:MAG: hypothetical protein HY531_00780 [Chloroflexi bacterium]|nr:hypothetical protein [Chloroflexota bacterium]
MSRRLPGRVPFAGLLLIAIGTVLLLQTLGVLPWGLWWELWRFWPVLLIIAGVALILGTRAPLLTSAIVIVLVLGTVAAATLMSFSGPARESVSELREPLGETKGLNARVRFGAGKISMGELPAGSPELVEGVFRGPGDSTPASYSLTRSGDQANLVLDTAQLRGWQRPGTQDWTVRLSQAVALDLWVQSGASDLTLDLQRLNVTHLEMEVGASQIRVTLPGKSERTSATIRAGAANLQVTIPQGVAARIKTTTSLASVDVDERRFPRSNGFYQSPEYDSAPYKLGLDIEGGAASILVR